MPTTVSSDLPWHDMRTAVQVPDNLISQIQTYNCWVIALLDDDDFEGSGISMTEPIQLLRHYYHNHHYMFTTRGCEVSCSSPDLLIWQFLIITK